MPDNPTPGLPARERMLVDLIINGFGASVRDAMDADMARCSEHFVRLGFSPIPQTINEKAASNEQP
jgi:hypothetical protein